MAATRKGQVVRTLEMRSRFLELRSALGVDEGRDRIRKPTPRITLNRNAACLDENRPAGAESTQRIVEPRGGADELGRGCRMEIGAAEPGRALEAPSLLRIKPGATSAAHGRKSASILGFLRFPRG